MSTEEKETTVAIEAGDCLNNVALEYGFHPDKIWNYGPNSELKQKRKDPNVLLEGDQVVVPVKELGPVSKAVEKKHRFRRKAVPCHIEFIVKRNEKPMKNRPYTAIIDGSSKTGHTDANGKLKLTMPPDARRCELTVGEGDEQMHYDFALGGIDPVDKPTGLRSRLRNLGYAADESNGAEWTDLDREALRKFQGQNGLEATGEPDDASRNKAKELFGC